MYKNIIINVLYAAEFFLAKIVSKIASRRFYDRMVFERKNSTKESESFRSRQEQADIAIEFSSEGEWEQVKPLALAILAKGKKIELIFSSESVERQIVEMKKQFGTQVSILRFPLITQEIDLREWISAPVLILVRYDFFPSLLRLRDHKKLILLNASLKKEKQKKGIKFYIKLFLYSFFDKIYFVNKDDYQLASQYQMMPPLALQPELRVDQILTRQSQFEQVLQVKIPQIFNYLSSQQKGEKIIFGSCWEEDLACLCSENVAKEILAKNLQVWIAPHSLDPQHVKKMKEMLKPFYQVAVYHEDGVVSPGAIQILAVKGILCEFYRCFSVALVGGGFKTSVHSLLEPFLAGCLTICGPRVERSTEYDLIRQIKPDQLVLLEMPEDFELEVLKSRIPYQVEALGLDFAAEIKTFIEETINDLN